MTSIPRVAPLVPERSQSYDLAIATLGFESRARFLVEHLQPKARIKIAGGFTNRQVLQYEKNRDFFKRSGWKALDIEDRDYVKFWVDTMAGLTRNENSPVKIWCDISSSSRLRIAALLDIFRAAKRPIAVDFVYCIASFSEPPHFNPPNGHVGPVTKGFAGWTEPDRGAVALVGLGYEQNKALGAVEHIQATDVWAFAPTSQVPEYSAAMKKANAILLSSIPRDRVVEYFVERPFDCFLVLESLTHRVASESVPVFFPFGPKVFALCTMLVGCIYTERVAVWRVSGGSEEMPTDRLPSKFLCGLRVVFDDESSREKPLRNA